MQWGLGDASTPVALERPRDRRQKMCRERQRDSCLLRHGLTSLVK